VIVASLSRLGGECDFCKPRANGPSNDVTFANPGKLQKVVYNVRVKRVVHVTLPSLSSIQSHLSELLLALRWQWSHQLASLTSTKKLRPAGSAHDEECS